MSERRDPVCLPESRMTGESIEGPVDPTQLLSAISSLLGGRGEVKGASEIGRIVSLMKESKKMVSKCIYMNILQSTKETEVLNMFIEKGGWEVLNTWLQAAKEEDDHPFLMELLRVYKVMPVTIDLLKKNNSAKTIKKLAAVDNSDLKELAGNIVDTWTKKIKEKGSDGDSNDKHKKHHRKHHHKSHHHHKSKDKSSSDKDHHNKRSESSRKGSFDSQADSPSSVQSNNNGKEDDKPPKSRTASAKTAPTRFRSTGLEAESVLPQIKKKAITEKPSIKRPIAPSNTTKVSTPPPEKKKKPMPLNQPLTSSLISQTPPTEPKGIKIIPAKPRPPVTEVYESSGFMDAITTTQSVRRKRKASTEHGKPQTSPPPQQKQVLPSFYTDTLEASPEKENVKEGEVPMTPTPIDQQSETSKDDASETASSVSESTAEEPVRKRKKNTRVSWAEESVLVSIRYFDMDDTERVNVNRFKNFAEDKKHEMQMEKQHLESNKRLHMHMINTKEVSEWRKPPTITGMSPAHVRGASSTEKEAQKKREESVLQALYFDKKMIPDSAAEPDLEEVEYEEAKIIPLSDGSGEVETVVDFSAEKAKPKPQQLLSKNKNKGVSLPPDIASLLSSLAKDSKQQQPMGQMSPQSMTSQPGSPDVQAVIQSIMTNTPNMHEDEATRNLRLALEPFKDQLQGLMNTNPSSIMPLLMTLQQPAPPHQGLPPQDGFPANIMSMGPPPNYMGPGPRGPPPRGYPRPPYQDGSDMRGGPPMMRGRMRGPMMMPNRGGGPPRGMPPQSNWNRGRGGPMPPQGRPSVCKFFASSGRCKWGDSCGFAHIVPNGPPM